MPEPQDLFTALHSQASASQSQVPHAEEIETEKLVNRLQSRAAPIVHMPRKYLRAFVAYMELRTLMHHVLLGTAVDGIRMAQIQGRLKEGDEITEFLRLALDYQTKDEADS